MCGRFTLTHPEREQLASLLGVPVDQIPEEGYRPRYNIAPTDMHWIVRMKLEDRELLPAKWGLVNSWAKDAKGALQLINARTETVERLSPFREAFAKRRCLIPADGFYEWTGPKEARQPLRFHRPDGGFMLFAGLYESWQPIPDVWQRTFTIITTEPNSLVREVHDRMPVILDGDAADEWMQPHPHFTQRLRELLIPAANDYLVVTPASPRVNSVKNDDLACLAADEAER